MKKLPFFFLGILATCTTLITVTSAVELIGWVSSSGDSTKQQYIVEFYLNGGTDPDHHWKAQIVDDGNNPTGPDPEDCPPIREGFVFEGFYKDDKFSGDPCKPFEETINSDTVFYAKWGFEEYSVRFDGNEGKIKFYEQYVPFIDVFPIKHGESVPTDKVPTEEDMLREDEEIEGVIYHYKFKGWNTSSAASDVIDVQDFKMFGDFSHDFTFYAVWQATPETIPDVPVVPVVPS